MQTLVCTRTRAAPTLAGRTHVWAPSQNESPFSPTNPVSHQLNQKMVRQPPSRLSHLRQRQAERQWARALEAGASLPSKQAPSQLRQQGCCGPKLPCARHVHHGRQVCVQVCMQLFSLSHLLLVGGFVDSKRCCSAFLESW